MGNHPIRAFHVVHGQPALLSLLGLVVLLPYLPLPAVYHSHLTAPPLELDFTYRRYQPLGKSSGLSLSPGSPLQGVLIYGLKLHCSKVSRC
jgi:hypothetical protein